MNNIRHLNEDFYFQEQKLNDLFYICLIHEKKSYNYSKILFYFDETAGLKIHKNNIDIIKLINDNFDSSKNICSSLSCEICGGYIFNIKARISRFSKY